MAVIIATTVADTKRGPRIWLEGTKLARGAFNADMRFDLQFKKGALTLTASPSGERKVSARKNSPIIDLRSRKLAMWFAPGEKLKAVIRRGRIVIRRIAQTIKTNRREKRIMDKIANGTPLNVVSAFSGGGVMDRAIHDGFKRSGIKLRTMLTYELEGKYTDANLRANPELFDSASVIVNGPIQDLSITGKGNADVFCAGLPCTGASLSGRAKRGLANAESHPEAGALFYSTLRAIETFSPSIIILENVAAYQNTASFEVIRSMMATWGYATHEAVLNGNDFGSLENRNRLVVIAVSKSLQTIGGFDMSHIIPVREKEATLSEALDTVGEDDECWSIHEYLEKKQERDIAAKKGFLRQLYTGVETYINTITRSYQKIRSTDPHIKHPTKERFTRLLNTVEHGRIKGLPTGWIESAQVSATIGHEILGQSIIFPLFDAIGAALGHNLNRVVAATTIDTGATETDYEPMLAA